MTAPSARKSSPRTFSAASSAFDRLQKGLALEEIPHRPRRVIDVAFGMGRGNEPCLKLRRSHVDAAFQQKVKQLCEPGRVALLRRLPIRHRLSRTEECEHRADAV